MRLWITILIVICTNLTFAQKSSLTLEWEVFQSKNDSMANYVLLEKMNKQAAEKDWRAAFATLERLRWHYLPDTLVQQLNSNAALISFLAKNPYRSRFYLSEWVMNASDTTKEMAFLGVMNYFQEKDDFTLFNAYYAKLLSYDSAYTCFACLVDAAQYQMPHRRFWKNTSRVIPGLGTIRAGKVFKGLTSTAYNGGILYNTYFFASRGMYFASAFWGVAVFQMFYSGNLVLTRLSIEDFEEKRQSELMNDCQSEIRPKLRDFRLQYKPIKLF